MAALQNERQSDSSDPAPRLVLVVEPDSRERSRIIELARQAFGRQVLIRGQKSEPEGSTARELKPGDVVIASVALADGKPPHWVRHLCDRAGSPVVIVLTDEEDCDLIARAIRHGVHDCLVKRDLRPSDLARAANRAILHTRLAQQNAKMVDQLRKSNAELDHFVRAMSHDMNANLMVLEDSLRRLKKSHDNAALNEISDGFAHVDACLRESHRFVDDLVTVAKSGKVPTDPSRVELSELVRDVLYQQRSLIQKRGAEVTVDPRLPAVWCHESRVKEILINLIRNALLHGGDHTAPKLAIVGAEPPDGAPKSGYCWVRVYDNGPGISDADRQAIFRPGHRLPNSQAAGTGHGLAIVKKSVEHYGGTVCVDPLCRRGFAVLFSLPEALTVRPPHGAHVREKKQHAARAQQRHKTPSHRIAANHIEPIERPRSR